MDVGIFKASRGRLFLWVFIPPFLILGVGLTSFALRQQSGWQLERTRAYAEVLPELVLAKRQADALIIDFNHSETGSVKTEDELISFLQNSAQQCGFLVNTLKVERRISAANGNMPVLNASVRGSGTFAAVQAFIGDVTSRQQLLTESALQISQGGPILGKDDFRAEISFELILFKEKKSGRGV